ncbi:unnamed protein product, partial [marine sediment metagenome]
LKGREFVISTQPFSNTGTIIRSVDGLQRESAGSDTTITTDEWSLLYSSEPGQSWLYHLPSDPKQQKNVINEHTTVAVWILFRLNILGSRVNSFANGSHLINAPVKRPVKKSARFGIVGKLPA